MFSLPSPRHISTLPAVRGKQTLGELPENDAHDPMQTSVDLDQHQSAPWMIEGDMRRCPWQGLLHHFAALQPDQSLFGRDVEGQ